MSICDIYGRETLQKVMKAAKLAGDIKSSNQKNLPLSQAAVRVGA
jgi:hypothetical protein